MISFSQYRNVLERLHQAGIQSRTIDSLHHDTPVVGSLYIKHDVEARMVRAVRMARIEAEFGHCATYYVQGDLLMQPGAAAHLQEIASLGHEVTYHYDVLDANDGNYDAALSEFEGFCNRFAEIGCQVTTVCPHGNPTKTRTGWNSNKDFFRAEEIRSRFPQMIDIVVDFPTLFPDGRYLSDAGRILRVIGHISTNDQSTESAMNDGHAVEWSEIGDLVKSHSGVVLSVHPHRFYENVFTHKTQQLTFLIIRKTYLKLSHIPIVRSVANRFYKIARRF